MKLTQVIWVDPGLCLLLIFSSLPSGILFGPSEGIRPFSFCSTEFKRDTYLLLFSPVASVSPPSVTSPPSAYRVFLKCPVFTSHSFPQAQMCPKSQWSLHPVEFPCHIWASLSLVTFTTILLYSYITRTKKLSPSVIYIVLISYHALFKQKKLFVEIGLPTPYLRTQACLP